MTEKTGRFAVLKWIGFLILLIFVVSRVSCVRDYLEWNKRVPISTMDILMPEAVASPSPTPDATPSPDPSTDTSGASIVETTPDDNTIPLLLKRVRIAKLGKNHWVAKLGDTSGAIEFQLIKNLKDSVGTSSFEENQQRYMERSNKTLANEFQVLNVVNYESIIPHDEELDKLFDTSSIAYTVVRPNDAKENLVIEQHKILKRGSNRWCLSIQVTATSEDVESKEAELNLLAQLFSFQYNSRITDIRDTDLEISKNDSQIVVELKSNYK
jgi:hypothetical protein